MPAPLNAAHSDIVIPPTSSPINPVNQRVPGLDGVRGIASLMVVIFHYVSVTAVVTPGTPASYAARALNMGMTGVDLFFVLSGFLITNILLESRHAVNYFRVFYVRRICRIFPLYYTVLAIWGLALLIFGGHNDLIGTTVPKWSFTTFTQNIAIGLLGVWSPVMLMSTWSLAIEEQFYAVLPAVVRRIRQTNTLAYIAIAVFIGSVVCRWLALHFDQPDIAYAWSICRADPLAAGMLIAVVHRRGWTLPRRLGLALTITLVPLTMFVVVRADDVLNYRIVLNSLTAVLYGLVVLLVLDYPQSVWSRALSVRPLRHLGTLSYSTYLFHPVILHLVFGFAGVPVRLAGAGDWLLVGISVLVTLILSQLSWTLLEKRALRIGHRMQYQYADSARRATV
jgi:peptidoglycan/LPS O-acetylase OafA/YrhL